MTLAQMAFEKISLLPEANIRIVLAMVDEMLRQRQEMAPGDEREQRIERKLSAVQAILQRREQSPFPPILTMTKQERRH